MVAPNDLQPLKQDRNGQGTTSRFPQQAPVIHVLILQGRVLVQGLFQGVSQDHAFRSPWYGTTVWDTELKHKIVQKQVVP